MTQVIYNESQRIKQQLVASLLTGFILISLVPPAENRGTQKDDGEARIGWLDVYSMPLNSKMSR